MPSGFWMCFMQDEMWSKTTCWKAMGKSIWKVERGLHTLHICVIYINVYFCIGSSSIIVERATISMAIYMDTRLKKRTSVLECITLIYWTQQSLICRSLDTVNQPYHNSLLAQTVQLLKTTWSHHSNHSLIIVKRMEIFSHGTQYKSYSCFNLLIQNWFFKHFANYYYKPITVLLKYVFVSCKCIFQQITSF